VEPTRVVNAAMSMIPPPKLENKSMGDVELVEAEIIGMSNAGSGQDEAIHNIYSFSSKVLSTMRTPSCHSMHCLRVADGQQEPDFEFDASTIPRIGGEGDHRDKQ
jgi:hypothetical protein